MDPDKFQELRELEDLPSIDWRGMPAPDRFTIAEAQIEEALRTSRA